MSSQTYEDNVKKWKKAYTEILGVCEKYADEFKQGYASHFSDIHEMTIKAKNHLMLVEWYEKYGLKLDHDCKPHSYRYIEVRDYVKFIHFSDAARDKDNGSGYFVSWSDDGRQPKDEWLLYISFSTGAYIFGEDYNGQLKLFQDFFNELKSYKPDYSDTTNKSLYWKLENAKPIYNEFNNILKKYRDRNKAELKQRKIERLRQELGALEEVSKQ